MTVLRPGDLVVLKSGGPVMTVDTVNTDIFDDDKVTGVLCAWFVGNRLERARFDCGAIVLAPASETIFEKTELQSPEATGAYKAVLDEMVTAMNDTVEAGGDGSSAAVRRRRRTARKGAADATAPGTSGVN